MTHSLRKAVALLLATSFLMHGFPAVVSAQDVPPEPAPPAEPAPTDPAPADPLAPAPETPAPEAPPGPPAQQSVSGKILELDGKTPVTEREVRILDAKTGQPLITTKTNQEGSFQLPGMSEGSYVLETDGVSQVFQITPDQPLTDLKILVPASANRKPLAGGAPLPTDAGTSQWVYIGAGAAVLVAGLIGAGAGVYYHNDNRKTTGGVRNNPLFFDGVGLDFGQVERDSLVRRTILLRNGTNSPITTTLSLATTTQFEFIGGDAPPARNPRTVTVPPLGYYLVVIGFRPTVNGIHLSQVTATYPGFPPAILPISGEGISSFASPFVP